MRVVTLDENNTIIGIKNVGNNYTLNINEMETELGEIGQIQQVDGSFITPTLTPTILEPTLEDKINYIYYKSIGVI